MQRHSQLDGRVGCVGIVHQVDRSHHTKSATKEMMPPCLIDLAPPCHLFRSVAVTISATKEMIPPCLTDLAPPCHLFRSIAVTIEELEVLGHMLQQQRARLDPQYVHDQEVGYMPAEWRV